MASLPYKVKFLRCEGLLHVLGRAELNTPSPPLAAHALLILYMHQITHIMLLASQLTVILERHLGFLGDHLMLLHSSSDCLLQEDIL